MQPPASPFESACLLEHLPVKTRRRIASLCVLDTVNSTSDYLLSRADSADEAAGRPANKRFDLCLAQSQTAGRGRFGNVWVSPPGGNVYLSAAWRASVKNTRADWLGLMTAVALARRLREAGAREVGVKWPNDLYCGGVPGAKLGGVLIERRGSLCVAGAGINVAVPARAGAAIDRPWATLAEAGLMSAAPGRLAALVVEAVVEAADCVSSVGAGAMVERFAPLDFLHGRPVEVVSAKGSFSGVARGVNREACLRVQAQGGMKICRCEEVSVRL